MRILLAAPSNSKSHGIAYGQMYPLLRFRKTLSTELGVEIEHSVAYNLQDIGAACQRAAHRVSAFVIRPDYRVPVDEILQFCATLRATYPKHRIVMFDPWDQCTGKFLGTLPYLDALVKCQTLKNRDDYYAEMEGGSVITDYVVRKRGIDLHGADVGSKAPEGYAQRIVTGPFLNMTRKLEYELLKPRMWPFFPWQRTIDIVCHVSTGARNDPSYYRFHRLEAVAAIRALKDELVVRTSAEHDGERTVTRQEYLRDMRAARIVVSPFGWGEVSTRDYECAAFGNLLMRPNVDHVSVLPDIFVPGKTYVPLNWDFSDLPEKARYYLAHWQEAESIIENARQACLNYYRNREYLSFVRDILGLPGAAPQHASPQIAPLGCDVLSMPGKRD